MSDYVDEVKPLLMVSNSEIKQFKECRRKWTLSSFNRRNLIPRLPNLKFLIGTGCHHALERWHGYGDEPITAFRSWAMQEVAKIIDLAGSFATQGLMVDLQEMVDLGVKILKHYKAHAEKHIIPKYEFVATEYEFSVPIPDQMIPLLDAEGKPYDWVVAEWGERFWEHESFKKLWVDRGLARFYVSPDIFYPDPFTARGWTQVEIPPLYVGRLDGLVRDKAGSIWVIDHKFMANLVDPEMLTIDEQISKYVWAANICIENGWWPEVPQGTLVRGALYNVIRKKAPTIPALNKKDGKTSVARNIDTTEEVFKATLLERGQKPSDYIDMLLFLREKNGWDGQQNKFFQLLPVERGERERELVGEKITYEYQDMAQIAAISKDIMHPALYPNPSIDCRWKCSYKGICYVANFGGDVDHMIEETMTHQKRTDLYASQLEVEPE